NRSELSSALEEVFRRHTTAEWLERLRGHVPVAPVCAVSDAVADAQALAREMVVEVEHPVFGALREIGCPIKVDDAAPRYRAGAALGADTEAVLREIGVGRDEVAALRTRGIV